MHMTAYTGKVPWPSSATARGLGPLGGNDKLAIDKGGNLHSIVDSMYVGLQSERGDLQMSA